MNSKIPSFLYEKGNITRLILLTALFALLFINIFQPFGSRSWYPEITDFKYFFFSSAIILTGMLVVVISRIIMFIYAKKNDIIYWQYIVWILIEVLAMSLFYTLFARFIPKGGLNRDVIDIFTQSVVNTAWMLLLPYSILWLYFSWNEKNTLLKKMSGEISFNDGTKKVLIAFHDERGELKISIMLDSLLYIESRDNYSIIYYLNKSNVSHFTLRNTLKWIEENIVKNTPLVRCHRSYIININQLKVFKKTKEGIFVEFESANIPDIAVSKTYYARVMSKFSKFSL